MKTNTHRDELHHIFKKHLSKIDSQTKTEKDLIFDVVADYIFHLMRIGNIPQHALSVLEDDLKEEVIEIYRKTTYGFHNLHQFKLAQKVKMTKKRNPQ